MGEALTETQIRRLQLKAAKSRAWEEAFKAKVASGQWERNVEADRARSADFQHMRGEKKT